MRKSPSDVRQRMANRLARSNSSFLQARNAFALSLARFSRSNRLICSKSTLGTGFLRHGRQLTLSLLGADFLLLLGRGLGADLLESSGTKPRNTLNRLTRFSARGFLASGTAATSQILCRGDDGFASGGELSQWIFGSALFFDTTPACAVGGEGLVGDLGDRGDAGDSGGWDSTGMVEVD
ncbi:hypothetical protein MPTK1_5g01580 [Marchantia polymorpha subsp. ruderalis]|uniref:Uncharacterized protein n=1 Tax=Marchantia polymorpha subsp. ruderalis TaxID=1480154 RepID=A0AAF6BDU5_MARPO|nr:hypothetical protein Mp_5g01580 [Marchantia polymorpha subsp. ruderalis]